MKKEIWKTIEIDSRYEISNLGRLRKGELIVRAGLAGDSCRQQHLQYAIYQSNNNGRVFHVYIARLVAMAFIPNPKRKPQVNHIDGNTMNNTVENLEWCTLKENIQHAWRTGMVDNSRYKNRTKGTQIPQHKLTEKQVRVAKHALSYGVRGTVTQLAKMFKVNHPTISDIKRGVTWKHIQVVQPCPLD